MRKRSWRCSALLTGIAFTASLNKLPSSCALYLHKRQIKKHASAAISISSKSTNARELRRSIDDDRQLIIRGGGSTIPQTQRRKLVVLLVATALFNDMVQVSMLLPIIHTLISNVYAGDNMELMLGVFFASKDICQRCFDIQNFGEYCINIIYGGVGTCNLCLR